MLWMTIFLELLNLSRQARIGREDLGAVSEVDQEEWNVQRYTRQARDSVPSSATLRLREHSAARVPEVSQQMASPRDRKQYY